MSVFEPKITIQMVIDENKKADNNVKVRLIYPFDPCENDTIWEGMLFDIPEEYRTLEYNGTGWLFKANCYYIMVWG